MNGTLAAARFKVLLVSTNRCATPEPVFPLGLAYLNAALRQAGHQTRWLDLLHEPDQLKARLKDFAPDIVGISVRNIDDVVMGKREVFTGDLARLVAMVHRQVHCPVVLGGSGFSIFPTELLERTGADYGIVGEGERAFVALLNGLAGQGDMRGIRGLVVRKGGVRIGNPSGKDSWALPLGREDRPPLLAGQYLKKGGVLNVQTQRGCPHRCCYCTYPVIEGKQHRSHSPQAVAADFKQLQDLGARYAFVVDSVFNSSEHHVREVCEALIAEDLTLRWGCFLRPQGLTRELMGLMARAGLAHVEFGSDSFCDEVLAAYQKDFTFEDVLSSSELAMAEGIDFCHFMIAGGPGETAATLNRSFENSHRLGGAIILAMPGMRIYPGTPLFERARAEGSVSPSMNLMAPAYYLAPGFSFESILGQLKGFASQAPNWIVGDFDPAYEKLVARLRQRGVTGPLWSYFATAQRLWPRREAPKV